MRFSDWHDLHDETVLPKNPGLFQLRLRAGLLVYPTGKSAMFYYGYAYELEAGCQQFSSHILPQIGRTPDELLLRTMPVVDIESRFKDLMQKFAANFGSLPMGNEIYLKILQAKVNGN